MRAKAGLLILLGLFLIIGTVSASVADSSSTMTSGKEWPVASASGDIAVITVLAHNSTFTPPLVNNAQVTFTIDDAGFGYFSQNTVTTDINGLATTSFITRTRSGTAVITATITSTDAMGSHTQVLTLNQKIDHNLAQFANFDTPEELTVGTEAYLNVTVTDIYGNRVDNRNNAGAHTFALHMPGNEGRGLWNGTGYGPVIQVTTDALGNASAKYRVAELSGIDVNYIYADPIGNMVAPAYAFIDGIAETQPWFITQTYPSPDTLPADGAASSVFEVYFKILDKYKNPIIGTPVLLTTSDGFSATRITNPDGLAYLKFGPKDLIGHYTLSGGPTLNTSALCLSTNEIMNCSQVVEYYNTDPVDLMVMANPQGMASLDVDSKASGLVQARVVDTKGNPVAGETVTFALGTPVYSDLAVADSGPTLSATTAQVATGGFATVTFTPGSFVGSTNPSYNATATGTVVVTASWTNKTGYTITRPVTFVWKNYPYLGISVPADACKNVAVGDTVNITVKLTGDGAALKPKPINAVLIMDVSGSMTQTPKMTGPNGSQWKLYYSKAAGKVFVDQMDSSSDHVGLVTYSYSPSIASALTTDFYDVKNKLDNMTSNGMTNQRVSTFTGLKMVKDYGADPTKTVQAIVLMTDGQYNRDGDPLARGTGSRIRYSEGGRSPDSGWSGADYRDWYVIPDIGAATNPQQNLVQYAKANNIKIYAVAFGTDAAIQPGQQDYETLRTLALSTDGDIYRATTGEEANDVYEKIAGALKETAGGNTQVALNFGSIKVNDIVGGGDVRYYMKYVPVNSPSPGPYPSDSTYLNKTHWFTNNNTMSFYSGYPYVQDDSVAWDNRLMSFTPGDIKLNDTWSANFRLKLNASGKIELFGPGTASQICFTDASTEKTTCQFIPALQCNIQESLVNEGIGDEYLFIGNLTAENTKQDPNILKVQYNVTYTGKNPLNRVTETIWYKPTGGQYKLFDGGVLYDSNCFEHTRYILPDTTSWPAGVYSIQVRGKANDSNGATITTTWEKKGPGDINYIKLE